MKFTQSKEYPFSITLDLERHEFDILLVMMGGAIGVAKHKSHMALYWRSLQFVNLLNEGNPGFQAYWIPEPFADETTAEIWAYMENLARDVPPPTPGDVPKKKRKPK